MHHNTSCIKMFISFGDSSQHNKYVGGGDILCEFYSHIFLHIFLPSVAVHDKPPCSLVNFYLILVGAVHAYRINTSSQ